jgi:hypothetical protein
VSYTEIEKIASSRLIIIEGSIVNANTIETVGVIENRESGTHGLKIDKEKT